MKVGLSMYIREIKWSELIFGRFSEVRAHCAALKGVRLCLTLLPLPRSQPFELQLLFSPLRGKQQGDDS